MDLFGSDDDDDDSVKIKTPKEKESSDEKESADDDSYDGKGSESDEKMENNDDDGQSNDEKAKESSSSSPSSESGGDDDDDSDRQMIQKESDDEVKRERVGSDDEDGDADVEDHDADAEDHDANVEDHDVDAEDAEHDAEDHDGDADDAKKMHDSDLELSDDSQNERDDEPKHDGDAEESGMQHQQSFIEDEEPAEEPIPETRFDVEIPRIVADLGKEMHFVKLPNFLSVETHPFDPQWYEDEIDEDEMLDEEGRSRLKLKVENTIRWRNTIDKDTKQLKRESNTRFVRWSDGTISLHLGDEIFDVHKLPMMAHDNNHLFIRQGTGLLGQAVFKTKLSFRPYSTESFTHRKLTLSLADRSQKTQKIRVLPNVGKDPEAHRSEMIKKEEDRLKASIRRENKQRRVRERGIIRGPTASYLEPDGDDDEEEDGISIAKIKKQYKSGAAFNRYTESDSEKEEKPTQEQDDDSDIETFDKRKSETKNRQIVESDDE